MKKLTIILLAALFPFLCLAEQKAITDTGDEVILYDDGTWSYINKETGAKKSIPTNDLEFNKGENLTFLLKSKKNDVGLWINPKKWSFKKSASNEDAEYELQLKGQDLYGMIITEKMSIPLETLVDVALENARGVAPDIAVVHKEYRMVNGNKVIQMQMNGTLQGIKVVYFGYYFSNEKGSTQVLAYTSQGLFEGFRKETVDYLNGFIVN